MISIDEILDYDSVNKNVFLQKGDDYIIVNISRDAGVRFNLEDDNVVSA